MTLGERYPMGATVTFADANATVSDGVIGLRTGTVNGPALCNEDTGEVLLVPVWSERDHGREATTVYVSVANIINVERKDP